MFINYCVISSTLSSLNLRQTYCKFTDHDDMPYYHDILLSAPSVLRDISSAKMCLQLNCVCHSRVTIQQQHILYCVQYVVQILHHQSSWELSGGVGDEIWCLVSLSSSSRRSLVSFASVIAMQITLCNSSTVITTAIQLHMKSKHTFTTNMLGFLITLLLQSRVPSPSKRSLN